MSVLLDVFVAVAFIAVLMLIRHIVGHAAAKRRDPCELKGCNFGCGGTSETKHP